MGTEDVLLSPESSGLPEPPADPGTMQGTGPAPSLCLPFWWLDCGPTLPEGCLSLGCCQHSDRIKGKGALFTALATPARLSPGTWLCPYMLRGFSGGPTGALAWLATRHWPQSVFLNPGRQSPQDGMGFRRQPGLIPIITPGAQILFTAGIESSSQKPWVSTTHTIATHSPFMN